MLKITEHEISKSNKTGEYFLYICFDSNTWSLEDHMTYVDLDTMVIQLRLNFEDVLTGDTETWNIKLPKILMDSRVEAVKNKRSLYIYFHIDDDNLIYDNNIISSDETIEKIEDKENLFGDLIK